MACRTVAVSRLSLNEMEIARLVRGQLTVPSLGFELITPNETVENEDVKPPVSESPFLSVAVLEIETVYVDPGRKGEEF